MSDGIVQAPEFIITQGNAFVGENASSSNNNIETRRFTVKVCGFLFCRIFMRLLIVLVCRTSAGNKQRY